MLRFCSTRQESSTYPSYCVKRKNPMGSLPASVYVWNWPIAASASAYPVVLVLGALVLNTALPSYTDRPFWSFRLRMIITPVFSRCVSWTHVRLSESVISVVGEDRYTRAGPLKLAKLFTVTSGMPVE